MYIVFWQENHKQLYEHVLRLVIFDKEQSDMKSLLHDNAWLETPLQPLMSLYQTNTGQ